MVQLNLLPIVKIEYIKTKKTKRAITVIGTLIIVVSITLVGIMFLMRAYYNNRLSSLDRDIENLTKQLESTPELTRIISVQNQLNTLPGLYKQRPAAYRLPDYLDKTTPDSIGISDVIVDFSTGTIEVGGAAPTLEVVNEYIDTLKFTRFITVKDGSFSEEKEAFNSVVMTSFSRDDRGATFKSKFNFDLAIFDESLSVDIKIPAITTNSLSPKSTFINAGQGER